MRLPVLKITVVGHTNTGKTSLLRTLTRDVGFGEVSNRPATTRHVEGTALLVEGQPLVELYDTPGMEDSIGLLEHLDSLRSDRHTDWIDILRRFLDSPAARGEFEQEAKVLRQVLMCDVALYVVDVRDRVLGKHRDELEILGRTARPVMPVLNFIASPEAKATQWREHLSRINMHVVAEFDTVVLDEHGERRLFEKLQTLLDPFRNTLQALIEDRGRQRQSLVHASVELLADLLIDVAAYAIILPMEADKTAAMESLKQLIRKREQQCVDALLELHRFRTEDYAGDALPIEGGQWGMDLFSPASLKQFGIRAGSAAAAGGMAGLAIDAMTGGLSLGAAAALGAAIGALWGGSRTHARRMLDRMRGFTELRANDQTLRLLALRQITLIQALLRRGHASQDKIRLDIQTARQSWTSGDLPAVLEEAKVNPNWSRLSVIQTGGGMVAETTPAGGSALPWNPTTVDLDADRIAAKHKLADTIEQNLGAAGSTKNAN